jgi:pSer/pThr/pTyr-binding forkhead associated (FHA) protein
LTRDAKLMWKLVIEDDEGKRTIVPLTRDDYTIGRKEGNSIRLTERNVSRDHAKLRKTNGAAATPSPGLAPESGGSSANGAKPGYVLEDLTSYNGVYVNGMRVATAQELVHGDLIQIGDYRIVLQDEQAVEEDASPLESDNLKATMTTSPGIPPPPGMPSPVATPSPLRASNAAFLDKPNRLVMLAGPTPGEEYPLVDDRLTIGRAEDATISVNHNSVSRLHCEVHALGEGRFEIVDKGSSNGVRVNGADLRRGIVEAGDIIELGDVKFKFVGRGQIFRPGASASQQLATISNRTATVVVGQGRSSILPAILLGALVAVGLAGAWAYTRQRPVQAMIQRPPASVSTSTPENPDSAALADAKRLCDSGDYEGAHQKIGQLIDPAPIRSTAEYKFIEYSWATNLLLHADTETDAVSKRAELERVAGTVSVDPGLRRTASDRLAALDQAATLSLVARDAGKGANSPQTSRPATVRTAVSQASSPEFAAPLPPSPLPPPKAPRTPTASPFETERTLALSSSPSDVQRAREMLEPRVFGRKASNDEVRLLKSICKSQHDSVCVQQCAQIDNGGN